MEPPAAGVRQGTKGGAFVFRWETLGHREAEEMIRQARQGKTGAKRRDILKGVEPLRRQ